MKKDDYSKLLSLGQATSITMDPDIKTEISRKQIDGVVADVKKHLAKRKKVHVIVIME